MDDPYSLRQKEQNDGGRNESESKRSICVKNTHIALCLTH